jgi:FSR family fosmidomycin resistance protein-like MFS transporter
MRSLEKEVPPVGEARAAEESAAGTSVRGVGLMTLAHYIDDIYPGFVPPLLPLFIDKFGISLTLAGLLGTVLALSTSVCQLGFGWLADRLGRRFFVLLGPLFASVFLSLAPLSSSYGMLVVLVAVGGLGVAAFHPSAASLTGAYAGKRKSLGVSVFAAAGAVGFATGPLLILWVITAFGEGRSYLAMAPGLILVVILAAAMPRGKTSAPAGREGSGSISQHWKLLTLLWFVAVIRAAVIMGFENFIPIIIREQGGTLMSGGKAMSLFLLCGSIGGIVGGYISDKVDARKVLLFSSIAPAPLFICFLLAPAPWSLVALCFAGAFAFAAVPVTIVLAQESVPGRTSVASSVVMGVAWGVGGTASAAVGSLADMTSVVTALFALALFSLVSAPCVPFLPSRRGRQRVVAVR